MDSQETRFFGCSPFVPTFITAVWIPGQIELSGGGGGGESSVPEFAENTMPLAQKDESDGGIDRDNVGKNFVVDSFDSRDVCRGRKSHYVLKWRGKEGG